MWGCACEEDKTLNQTFCGGAIDFYGSTCPADLHLGLMDCCSVLHLVFQFFSSLNGTLVLCSPSSAGNKLNSVLINGINTLDWYRKRQCGIRVANKEKIAAFTKPHSNYFCNHPAWRRRKIKFAR